MSYITKNEPNVELVKVFEKLTAEDLTKLAQHCINGNFGIIATAISAAVEKKVH